MYLKGCWFCLKKWLKQIKNVENSKSMELKVTKNLIILNCFLITCKVDNANLKNHNYIAKWIQFIRKKEIFHLIQLVGLISKPVVIKLDIKSVIFATWCKLKFILYSCKNVSNYNSGRHSLYSIYEHTSNWKILLVTSVELFQIVYHWTVT